MRTRQARINEIEKARRSLEAYDQECKDGRKMHVLVLRNAFDAFVNEYPGSLRDLAARIGFSPAYLSDIRNGNRGVSKDVLMALGKLK